MKTDGYQLYVLDNWEVQHFVSFHDPFPETRNLLQSDLDLDRGISHKSQQKDLRKIGLLDIYGFEVFEWNLVVLDSVAA